MVVSYQERSETTEINHSTGHNTTEVCWKTTATKTLHILNLKGKCGPRTGLLRNNSYPSMFCSGAEGYECFLGVTLIL